MSTLDVIKTLREKTGSSLQACKKALDECNGDEAKAIEHLRKMGQAKAAKRSDRTTTEGVVAIAKGNGKAVIIKLACETDFVAKNPDFVAAAETFANQFLEQGIDRDVTTELNDLGLKMGEKVSVDDVKMVEGATLGDYIHSNKKVGAVIALDGSDEATAKEVAMHITAMNPLVISPDEVDDEMVKAEKNIWIEQLKQENKPAEIMEKIMMGKEKKFREENALLKQAFVKNPDQTIEAVLKGGTVKSFARLGS